MGATQTAADHKRLIRAEGFRTPRLHDRFHPGEIQHLIRRLGLGPGQS